MASEDLTNEELRQLIASNAKAIQANSADIAELRQSIAETREILAEGFIAVQTDIDRLTQLMSGFFTTQMDVNGAFEQRLQRLEGEK